ncbi:MAG: MlaD family protein, partial [Gammaproteobacteria bacterium]
MAEIIYCAAMESKTRYTLTGLFVVVLSTVLIIIAFWLSKGLSKMQYKTYRVYMHESVTGLNLNAPVKYNGVKVGYVSYIELDSANPQYVILRLEIEAKVPIREDVHATLMSQGLTGVSFVNLTGGSLASPILRVRKGERYPVIEAEPSLLFRLDSALSELSGSLTGLTNEMKAVLDIENRTSFKNTLKNLDILSTKLAANSTQFEAILKNTAEASKQINVTLQTVNQSLPQFTQIINQVNAITTDVQREPTILMRGKSAGTPGPGE